MITNEKKIPTKQDKDPYIWDYNIKIAKKNARIRNDGSNIDITADEISIVYDYEEETKVKVKKLDHPILQKK